MLALILLAKLNKYPARKLFSFDICKFSVLSLFYNYTLILFYVLLQISIIHVFRCGAPLCVIFSVRTSERVKENAPNHPALLGRPPQLLIGVTIQVSYLHGEWIFFVLSNSYELVQLQRYQND